MIYVVAKSNIKPECIDAYRARVLQLVADTNAKDAGCVRYELFQDVKDSGIFTMLEEWETMEDLQAHMAADHFKSAIEATKDYVASEGDIHLYQKVVD